MKRLYVRIYLAVLASIVLSVLLAGIAWRIFSDGDPFVSRQEFFAEAAQAMLPPAGAPAGEQKKALEKWRRLSGVNLVLLDRDGKVIAGAGQVDMGPSDGGRFRGARDNWHRRSVALKDGRVLIGERPPRAGRPFAGPGILFILFLVGVAVAIAAWPIVRRLTRDLERLEHSVAAFGAGDLAARSPVRGRDEVARVARTFNEAAERVEQLMRSNASLLANASHELRSPLARLRMSLEGVKDQASPKQAHEINQNIHELDALVEEILLASRLDARGGDALSLESVDLAGLAAEECARAGTDLELDGQGFEIAGDPRLLRRLVRNLIENAMRHGGGRDVSVRLEKLADGVAVAVCDLGPGVPDAERERIFEPFYRPSGASERSGGVGLGLSLVRQIARSHGGDVACTGRDGGGACFRAWFSERP